MVLLLPAVSGTLLTEEEFLSAIQLAIDTGEEFDMTGLCVTLTAPIRIKHRQCLAIRGGCIYGGSTVHSLFILNSHKSGDWGVSLTLFNTTLLHAAQSANLRDIGAAVFAMGIVRVRCLNCNLHSLAGFPIWLKHSASANINDSTLCGGRTGVAIFNSSSLCIANSFFKDFSIHGVCMRAKTSAKIENCSFERCAKRAIYCYEQAQLETHDLVFMDCPQSIVIVVSEQSKSASAAGKSPESKIIAVSGAPAAATSAAATAAAVCSKPAIKFCHYFQQGNCIRGASCWNAHVMERNGGSEENAKK
jgi:hypothetical protein